MYVIIVGGGKVGLYLAQMLHREGMQVHVIEKREDHVTIMLKELPAHIVIHGSGTDPLVLEKAGILEAEVVAAVTGDDETNLVVTNLARLEFGVGRTIARINNPKNAWMFTREMGVDVALNQPDLIAHLIREEMSLSDMMTLLKLRQGQYSLVAEKVHPASQAIGRAISELGLPERSVITAILRAEQLIIPRGNIVIEADDEVLALCHADSVAQLEAILGTGS